MSLAVSEAALGIFMFDNNSLAGVVDRLTSDDFESRRHQIIYSAITELHGAGNDFDALSVAEFLDQRDQLEIAGGFEYLASLALETASTANIAMFVAIIRQAARQRRIKAAAQQLIESYDFEAAEKQLREALEAA
ncbi:MAG: DnaB-like helicase N-terminal domain-containing protein [Steroidobacter sp.]